MEDIKSCCCLCWKETQVVVTTKDQTDKFVPILKAATIKLDLRDAGLKVCDDCHCKLKEVLRFLHKIKTVQGERKVAASEKKRTCDVCNRVFKSPSGWQEHKHVHGDRNKLCCEVCGRTFQYRRSLKAHLSVHSGEKPWKCEKCGRDFRDRTNLQNHLRTHETNGSPKQFSCNECSEEFNKKSNLQRHMKRRHNEEKASHQCPTCQKSFAVASDLKEHVVTHSQERKHGCTVCDKTFKFKNCLRKHLLLHKGEMPHQCLECDRRFRDKGNMLKHMRRHSSSKKTGSEPEKEDAGKDKAIPTTVIEAEIIAATPPKNESPLPSAATPSVIVSVLQKSPEPPSKQTRRVIVSPTSWTNRCCSQSRDLPEEPKRSPSVSQQVIVYSASSRCDPVGQPSQVITHANNHQNNFHGSSQSYMYAPSYDSESKDHRTVVGSRTECANKDMERSHTYSSLNANAVYNSTDEVMGFPSFYSPKPPLTSGEQAEKISLDSEVENLLENFTETREIIVANSGIERDMYPFDFSYL